MKFSKGMHHCDMNRHGKIQVKPICIFEEISNVTYNEFVFISKSVMGVFPIFGEQKQWSGKNILAKFERNPVCSLWENG